MENEKSGAENEDKSLKTCENEVLPGRFAGASLKSPVRSYGFVLRSLGGFGISFRKISRIA